MKSEDTPVLNKGDEEFDTPVLNKGDREVREGAFSETGCFGVISKLGLGRILAKRIKRIVIATIFENYLRKTHISKLEQLIEHILL